jgi:osmotically inducible protein OsmC
MNVPDDITRKASVHWEGDIARGHGQIDGESGKVSANYSFGTRFAKEPGTNPEELLAASHAACFTMALTLGLTRAGHAPQSVDTSAAVTLAKDGEGFTITHIALVSVVTAPGLDAAALAPIATNAKENCPISKALAAVEISLDAKLA